MKKVISVVGARPNFIKIAPLHRSFQKYKNEFHHLICHTGQHFDEKMSAVFFNELEMPRPTYNLGISGGSHAYQVAHIMLEFEKILIKEKPDLVVVPGDVNSTMACSVVASKMGVKLAHIESGLRSFNRQMPEEINRLITDVLADFLFVSEPSGLENLNEEGISSEKIFYVGNIMIDSLVYYKDKISKADSHKNLGLNEKDYVLVTFHRPSNVDSPEKLLELLKLLSRISEKTTIVFPIHPRTSSNIEKFKLGKYLDSKVIITEPLGYLDFLSLVQNSKLVITDSGGIQEECTYMNVPCVTARNDTERPVTVKTGTNYLGGTEFNELDNIIEQVLSAPKKGAIPKYWDGKTAERIVDILVKSV